ncbi:MAG TPA: sulfur carrier protein ThiS [Angustibacter sp.]|nr:sulfur carrier protein ThiS [Angustibacter sp.]
MTDHPPPDNTVTVNGRPVPVGPGCLLADVVRSAGADRAGIAVALNASVVARSAWPVTTVRAGDVVEIVTAVQGG